MILVSRDSVTRPDKVVVIWSFSYPEKYLALDGIPESYREWLTEKNSRWWWEFDPHNRCFHDVRGFNLTSTYKTFAGRQTTRCLLVHALLTKKQLTEEQKETERRGREGSIFSLGE